MLIVKAIRKHLEITAISFIYLLSFLYMLPLRDEICGDEFAYLSTVRDFVHTGILKISDWSYASFIFQTLWGAAFAGVFGFSFKAMQLSTLVLLYFGLISFYLLLRELSVGKLRSVFFTLLLLFFPLVFFLSYTFLTYIPSMSLLIIAGFMFVRGFKRKKWKWFFFGNVISSIAFLNRQDGLILPIAFFLMLIFWKYAGVKIKVRYIILSFLPPLLTVLWYAHWNSLPGNLTVAQVRMGVVDPSGLADTIMQYLPIPYGRIQTTNIYYAKYIQNVIFYFFDMIGFLLPIFIIFKVSIKRIVKLVIQYRIGIIFMVLFFLFTFGIEYIFHYHNDVYEIDQPESITAYSSLLHSLWLKMLIISTPIWITLIGYTLQKFFNSIFLRRKKIYKKFFNLLLVAEFFLIAYPYVKSYLIYYRALASHIPLGTLLKQSWLVPTVFVFFTFLVTFIIFFFKLRKNVFKLKSEVVFLVLVFCFYAMGHIFFMRFHWDVYIPTLLPFVIIWLACISKSVKIRIVSAVLVLGVFIFFSLSITKMRYEEDGFGYEVASKLVEKGVNPVDVAINGREHSWLPWWYYKSTNEEATRKNGGNKYTVDDIGTWHYLQDIVPTTLVREVPVNFNPSSEPTWNILVDTGPRYSTIFTQKRYIGFKIKMTK